MESPMVTETEEIELQALALHHLDVGDIVDMDGGEIRLPGDGAEARELRAIEAHPIVVLRMLVGEGLQHLGRVILPVDGLATQEAQLMLVLSCIHYSCSPLLLIVRHAFLSLQIFLQAMLSELASGAMATSVGDDTIVTGECALAHQVEYT